MKRKIIISLIICLIPQMVYANFTQGDKERICHSGYEHYEELDYLGRCQGAEAYVGVETMPIEKRKSISYIYPSGWANGMGYERCHLIAFCLTGENGNCQNLVTGTHYLNIHEMLPIEMEVLDYIEKTNNHIMYRSTPLYIGDNPICESVHIEAKSVEDNKINIDSLCKQEE